MNRIEVGMDLEGKDGMTMTDSFMSKHHVYELKIYSLISTPHQSNQSKRNLLR